MGIWKHGPRELSCSDAIAVTIVMRFSTSPSDNWIRGTPCFIIPRTLTPRKFDFAHSPKLGHRETIIVSTLAQHVERLIQPVVLNFLLIEFWNFTHLLCFYAVMLFVLRDDETSANTFLALTNPPSPRTLPELHHKAA